MPLAGSPAVASRPAEAARCFEVACEHPDARLPSEYARCGENLLRTQQAHTNTRPMPASGWMGATCSRRAHPPTMSGDFSRSNARGRSDLHSLKDARTSQTHGRPGMLPDRRGMKTASSPFRQNGDSRLAATGSSGFREQIDGLGWPRASLCIGTRDPRDEAPVPRAGWPAGPDIPPGERRWNSEANAEAARRRERMALLSGHGPVGLSKWHVWSAI